MKPAPSLDYAGVVERKRRLAEIRKQLRGFQAIGANLTDDQLGERVRLVAEQKALERELILARW